MAMGCLLDRFDLITQVKHAPAKRKAAHDDEGMLIRTCSKGNRQAPIGSGRP